MLIFLFVIVLLNAVEGTLNKFKSILDGAPTHCFNISTVANDAGNNSVFFVNITETIPVAHTFITNPKLQKMETTNLWMFVGRNVKPRKSQLLYIPGRTIIFDDTNKALLYLGMTNVTIYNHCLNNINNTAVITKAKAMTMITNILSKNYDSMVFRQHLDRWHTSKCNGHCCKKGTPLKQEIVSLRGWNISQCPGHKSLSWSTGPCDCLHTRFC